MTQEDDRRRVTLLHPPVRPSVPLASPAKIRKAKMDLVYALMSLDDCGVDISTMNMQAAIEFARKLR